MYEESLSLCPSLSGCAGWARPLESHRDEREREGGGERGKDAKQKESDSIHNILIMNIAI